MGFIIIVVGVSILGGWVTTRLKQRMQYYSQIPAKAGKTGAEYARAMLRANNIHDVSVVEGKGKLTDHYHPKKMQIVLSPDIYRGASIAANAVAAHETGHAIQHNVAYPMLKLRSALVPLMRTAGMIQQFLLIGALIFYKSFPQLMLVLIAAFALTTLFSLITLPVEFDASKRALSWMSNSAWNDEEEHLQSKDALRWAALTYVVKALSSFLILLYFVYNYLRPRN